MCIVHLKLRSQTSTSWIITAFILLWYTVPRSKNSVSPLPPEAAMCVSARLWDLLSLEVSCCLSLRFFRLLLMATGLNRRTHITSHQTLLFLCEACMSSWEQSSTSTAFYVLYVPYGTGLSPRKKLDEWRVVQSYCLNKYFQISMTVFWPRSWMP